MNNKHTYFYALVEAIKCNPNGDPANDNFPRINDIENGKRLEISSYSIKRKIRNAWDEMGLNVILSSKKAGKTLPACYNETFKEILGEANLKTKTGIDKTDLTKLTFEEYSSKIDSIFGLFKDGRVELDKNNEYEILTKIKNNSLSISSSYSLQNVNNYLENFKKSLTSHYTSGEDKKQGSIGTYNQIGYALFPITGYSLSNYNDELVKNIMLGIYNGFNNNITSSKNFNVKGVIAIKSDILIKKDNFIIMEDENSTSQNPKLVVKEDAKNINVEEGFILTKEGKVDNLVSKNLFDALSKII